MTVYANVVDNKVKGVYDLIPKFWNGISDFNTLCSDDENFMHENGFVKIVRDTTQFDPTTHKMSDIPTYTVEDDKVYEHRELITHPPYIPLDPIDLLTQIRETRDRLMSEFEWRYSRYDRQVRLGLPTSDNIENLDNYMQALADITLQTDLENIVWPTYQE